jgi:two-component system NtrC family sensor kinase
MKKYYFSLLLFIPTLAVVVSQASAQDISKQNQKDSNQVMRLLKIASNHLFVRPDSSIIFAKEALSLARQLNFVRGEGQALSSLGEASRIVGDFPQALEALFNALRISRDIKDQELEANSLTFIGIVYTQLGEYRQGLNYLFLAKKINENLALRPMSIYGLAQIGHAYERMHILDSALFFEQQAFQLQTRIYSPSMSMRPLQSAILIGLGDIQAQSGNYSKALNYYRQVIRNGDLLNLSGAQYRIADLFNTQHEPDSSLHYALLAFNNGQRSFTKLRVLDATTLLAKIYKSKNKPDSAYHYLEIAMEMKDSLFGPEKFQRLQLLTINEQQRQQEIQQEKESFKSKIKLYVLLAIVGVFLLIAIIFYRNNRQKQKANALLEYQKSEIQKTLSELKSTQSQLIQSEKMASLGELTAGVAHEIQNPLNFVNNFSELNSELIVEMQEELKAGNSNEAIAISNNIKENQEKINHHGKRADAIVKGMLQHSRSSSGIKEPTDINELADEYLRLAYHGLRAKDKSFNAAMKTDFDENLEKINIIPQDIGRVILNLITNAFYSVAEKKKRLNGEYEPTVTVSTKAVKPPLGGLGVLVSVKDNGMGISKKVMDKIFQPFFTTKPTGQGTGLGLSLSYDIITKGHGGQLKVETKDGEGAEFIILLPVK